MMTAAYITLTEAMTELAEGQSWRADDFKAIQTAREEARIAQFLASARSQAAALIKAGVNPSTFTLADRNPLVIGFYPEEVGAHLALTGAHAEEREEEATRFRRAGQDIIAAGARGELKLRGRFNDEGRLETIDIAELCYLAFDDTSLDEVCNRTTGRSWKQVTIERAEFARWIMKNRKATAAPSVASEKKALEHLTMCLKADGQLTRARAKSALKDAQIALSGKGFDRAWPIARENAGLSSIGSPGRKKKS